jgi:hypothetical protein
MGEVGEMGEVRESFDGPFALRLLKRLRLLFLLFPDSRSQIFGVGVSCRTLSISFTTDCTYSSDDGGTRSQSIPPRTLAS